VDVPEPMGGKGVRGKGVRYLFFAGGQVPFPPPENIRYAIKRSRPYGSEGWVGNAAAQFGLQTTLKKRGRPGKGTCPFDTLGIQVTMALRGDPQRI